MPIEVFEDDLNIVGSEADTAHLITQHATDLTPVMAAGGNRKSKFNTTEGNAVRDYIFPAFQRWKSIIRLAPHAGPNGGVMVATAAGYARRVVQDVDMAPTQVGTGQNGSPTTWVRLVMEITNSGNVTLITAFPL